MFAISMDEAEMVGGGMSAVNTGLEIGLGQAASGALGAFGEGLAVGLECGAWLGPAGAVVGAVAGGLIAIAILE